MYSVSSNEEVAFRNAFRLSDWFEWEEINLLLQKLAVSRYWSVLLGGSSVLKQNKSEQGSFIANWFCIWKKVFDQSGG